MKQKGLNDCTKTGKERWSKCDECGEYFPSIFHVQKLWGKVLLCRGCNKKLVDLKNEAFEKLSDKDKETFPW